MLTTIARLAVALGFAAFLAAPAASQVAPFSTIRRVAVVPRDDDPARHFRC